MLPMQQAAAHPQQRHAYPLPSALPVGSEGIHVYKNYCMHVVTTPLLCARIYVSLLVAYRAAVRYTISLLVHALVVCCVDGCNTCGALPPQAPERPKAERLQGCLGSAS